jgi:hypothetical protein
MKVDTSDLCAFAGLQTETAHKAESIDLRYYSHPSVLKHYKANL